MMDVTKLIGEGIQLFNAQKYDEAIQKLNEALASIPDKTKDIQNQVNALFGLGRCYMEQAIKALNAEQADQRFAQAIEHFKEQLDLAGKLDGQNGIQEQVNARYWLGYCYMQQAIKTSDAKQADQRFDKAIEHFQEALDLAGKLDGQNGIQEQVYAQSWLGQCYMQQAIKTSDARQTDERFDQAIKHFQERLHLAEQLDGQNGIQEQGYAQSWLGGCYFEQASKISDARQADQRFDQAIKHFQERLHLAEQLDGQNGIQQQVYAQKSLGYFLLEKNKKSKTVRENKNTIKNYFEQAKILCEKLLD
ncbi:tetratricopeptide repeat protein [Neisseria sp. Dent CA1/247]|uniref:tetratricopeptide repeat protein n=1 Tax=Neisseria sp. Dent CA1/247 TaxID=2912675 RepID=UPI001FD24BC2|nr:tetratricopeptide repeat protein [Neisseria sp. Dent CA1/247]UOO76692.1 tetratricopeptide repeat protein [Neisseria sp. Dent CA1/247]